MQNPYDIFLRRYGSLTEIQAMAVGIIGSGRNCLVTAPTGSGKTEAAILPILNNIYKKEKRTGIQAVYITPLRALNRDLIKRLESICRESGITVNVRHGDTTQVERRKQAESPPDLLITTPESLQTILISGKLKPALKSVGTVLVDEIHELYYNKRGAQLAVGLERLRQISREFQRIGISATVGNAEEVGSYLFGSRKFESIRSRMSKEFEIRIEMPTEPGKDYEDVRKTFGLDNGAMARLARVASLIRTSEATLVFTNTRQVAESLGSRLIYLNKVDPFGNVEVHHSSLDKEERIRVENDFKDARVKSIIATSSLELGIDIGRVNLVVQYGSPKQAIRLIQRVGRAGHREKAISSGRILVADPLEAIEAEAVTAMMLEGKLERHGMESNALDVALNQVCALAMEYKKIDASKAYEIIHASAPYRDLDIKQFDRLLELGMRLGVINYKNGSVGMGSRSFNYFFSNISVIPDSMRFVVKNVINNRIVSSLDEKFVYSYLDQGATFITKGLPWRVVDIEDGVIHVEPSNDVEASVPDWDGEDIPVSFEIASSVFAMLSSRMGSPPKGLDKDAADIAKGFALKQGQHFLPHADKVVVEQLDNYSIIYSGLGKLANEFLAKVIASILNVEAPGSAIRATPYAIVIEYANSVKEPDMKKVFGIISEGGATLRVNNAIYSSDLFRYKFIQIATLFGAVEKKAAVTKSAATRLMEFYRDSQVFEETMRDMKKNYLDADTATWFLKRLNDGEITPVFIRSAGSPLSEQILKSAYHHRELLMPNIPTDADIKSFKESIDGEEVSLLCTFCGFVSSERISVEGNEHYLCHSCKSPMLAMYKTEYESAVKKRIVGKRMNAQETANYESAIKEAGMISAYGNRALVALSTYGIGLSTAARLLKFLRNDPRLFFVDLIEAQKTFVRTKRFWKGKVSTAP